MTGIDRMLLRSTTALGAALVALPLAAGPALSEQAEFQDPWLETQTGIWTGDPIEETGGEWPPAEIAEESETVDDADAQDPWLETVTGIRTGAPLDQPKGAWRAQYATSGERPIAQMAEVETYWLQPEEYDASQEEPQDFDAD